ncbi:MAG: Holliday junction branch migration protein RuvA [Leptospiraceae bacterium]|nr:Holliday junction branch migration protein RuvA [Leptospiraceae bacterium]
MISKLKGKVTRVDVQTIYIDTGTVEYEVHVPLNVIEEIQKNKKKVWEIYIYHYNQGELERLYGFLEFTQRELFKIMISLKGIGPSLGLSLLSHLNVDQLLDACEKHDIETLTRIPRIGISIAESLIFEVNRKKAVFQKLRDGSKPISVPLEDVISGLKNLGYKEKQIQEAIRKIQARKELPQTASDWIRETLKIIKD